MKLWCRRPACLGSRAGCTTHLASSLAGRQLVGLLNTLRGFWSVESERVADIAGEPSRPRPRSARGTARLAGTQSRNRRRLHLEELEARRLLTADVVPQVLLGSVYF